MPIYLSSRLALGLGAALAIFPLRARAELAWDQRQLTLDATTKDETAVGIFSFHNPGKLPVTIVQTESDCGCSVVKLAKRTYAPGENGALTATFTVGVRVGLQNKHIKVFTDDDPTRPTNLELEVNIKPLVLYTPELVRWKLQGPNEERSIEVKSGTTRKMTALNIAAITPINTATATVEVVEPGRSYRILLRPASTARSAEITIACIAKFEDKSFDRFSVIGFVK
jgi:uncharacterized protein DUF1573